MAETQKLEPTKSGILKVENGTRDCYWEYFGEGKKEVVVLLNGLAMDTRSWHSVLPAVHPQYDVLLYDYFGQGRSSIEDEPYFMHKQAGMLIQVMDHLGVDKVHPMGVSYGGYIALELGRLHQDRLHTLTISGILLEPEWNFQLYHDISLHFYKEKDPAFEIYTHYMYEKIFGDAFAGKIYGEPMKRMRENFYGRYKDIKHCLIRLTEAQTPHFESVKKNLDQYRAIKTPTLLLAGLEDRAIPIWWQKKMLNIIPNSKMIEIPACGHLTYLERPDVFWPNLLKLVSSKSVNF